MPSYTLQGLNDKHQDLAKAAEREPVCDRVERDVPGERNLACKVKIIPELIEVPTDKHKQNDADKPRG